jgi:hypothetical protein
MTSDERGGLWTSESGDGPEKAETAFYLVMLCLEHTI